MPRRAALRSSLVVLALAAALGTPAGVSARCATPSVAAEAARSLYVFEGRLVAVDGHDLTFEVLAVWQGTPPARVTAGTSGRRPLAGEGDVGTVYLVFAGGDDPSSLSINRCGSSRPIGEASHVLDELRAAGRTRTAR